MISQEQLLDLLENPTIEMQEAGSLASDYELSQNGAAKVWRAMVSMGLSRLEHNQQKLASQARKPE